ncbi:MAG: acyl-CoA desaturase, partial [Ignavibacteriae bacterium]|nr:acyl-CoA desaturase [Ignavibacteriota bacterium]
FIELEATLNAAGVFKPNYFFEFVKLLLTLVPIIYGYISLYSGKNGILGPLLILAFGQFYSAWVAHDFSHHNVNGSNTTRGAFINDYIGCIIGGFRGNAMLWWKKRHNPHHISTNEVHNDPDIKLMPILHFFENFIPNKIQRFQHLYYVPMFLFLHIYWLTESIFITKKNLSNKNSYERKIARMDLVGLSLHIFFSLLLVFRVGLIPVLTIYYISGFLTALVVFSTHYGEERLNPEDAQRMSLVEQMLTTSRNIAGFINNDVDNYVWNWLTGGLNYQIEHHIFPRTPSYNLPKITPYVKDLARKYNLEYKNSNLIECTRRCCEILYLNMKKNLVCLKSD